MSFGRLHVPGVTLNSPVPVPEEGGGSTCHGAVLFLEQSAELCLARVILLGCNLRGAAPAHPALTILFHICALQTMRVQAETLRASSHLDSHLFTADSHFLFLQGLRVGTGSPVHQSVVPG